MGVIVTHFKHFGNIPVVNKLFISFTMCGASIHKYKYWQATGISSDLLQPYNSSLIVVVLVGVFVFLF